MPLGGWRSSTPGSGVRAGGNPDRPADQCEETRPPVADAVQLVDTATAWVTFSFCTGRGADNGVRRVQVTQSLLALLMDPLHTGAALGADLPD
jgi:hypothetical protein